MADRLCWRAAVSIVYVAADSSWLSCAHKSKQRNSCWFDECCATLHLSEAIIHLKSPTISTLSNTLSNASPSLINNECFKYLCIQVAAQACVTDQNQITMNGLQETWDSQRCRLSVLAERNACVTELSNIRFVYRQAFLFCIVWKTKLYGLCNVESKPLWS